MELFDYYVQNLSIKDTKKYEKMFEFFIEEKFDINYQNIFEMVVIKGSDDLLKKLVQMKDVNINKHDGMALIYCCEKNLFDF